MSETFLPKFEIVEVCPDSAKFIGIYCIKDKKADGFKAKNEWMCSSFNHEVRLIIALNDQDKQVGFIEYIPSEKAWRPLRARNFIFIQCIAVFSKSARKLGLASMLINQVEKTAKAQNKSGVCVICSEGAWMANSSLFKKNGFSSIQKKGRFDLLVKIYDNNAIRPEFIDWDRSLKEYMGWHLVYANQCPWHIKSVEAIKDSASEHGILLKIKQLNTPEDAQNGPSGYGTFGIIKDGVLLADHYISRTRFENILKKYGR